MQEPPPAGRGRSSPTIPHRIPARAAIGFLAACPDGRPPGPPVAARPRHCPATGQAQRVEDAPFNLIRARIWLPRYPKNYGSPGKQSRSFFWRIRGIFGCSSEDRWFRMNLGMTEGRTILVVDDDAG